MPPEAPSMQADESARPDSLTLIAFGLLILLGAANVVAVRFTVRELPPFWGAGTRFAIASLLFVAYIWQRHLPLPRGRPLLGALLFGLLQFGLGFALAYWALLKVPAGLASVILASVPLFTLLFAFAARLEPLRLKIVLGAVVALAGIGVIFGERAGGDIPAPYLLATVGTAACFALAPVVVKLVPEIHPATMNGVGMFTGAFVLLVLSWASGESHTFPSDPVTWAAHLYLILPGSVGVFALFLFLLGRWTASGVSFQTVLSPVFAIAFSAWLLDEPLTSGLFLGSILVFAGVYFGALRGAGRRG
jgi:drug/metabolite transporter (DMT)-like permease